MARIAGVNLPLNKRVEVGLTYVHGVGRSTSNELLEKVGIDPNTYVKDLTEDETVKLRDAVEELEVEGDLRRERSQNIKRLSEIGSYPVAENPPGRNRCNTTAPNRDRATRHPCRRSRACRTRTPSIC